MLIVKTNLLNSTFKRLEHVQIEDAAEWKTIIKLTLLPKEIAGKQNSFTTVLPLTDQATQRCNDTVFYGAVTQPIILEFDHDQIEHQFERAKYVSGKVPTIQQLIFSGNKSYHHVLWFKNFANNAKEYREKCLCFYRHLTEEYPDIYEYCIVPADKLKKSNPVKYGKINWSNVPDTKMFIPSIYYRQAGGKRDNGKIQKLTILNSGKEFEPLDLSDYIVNVELPVVKKTGIKNDIKKGNKSDDIYSIIKEEVHLREFIEKEIGGHFQNNGKLNPCPICSHNDCFTLGENQNVWKCFSDQHDSGGTIIDLVMEWKKWKLEKAAKWIAKKANIEWKEKPKKENIIPIVFKKLGKKLVEVCYSSERTPDIYLCSYEGGETEFHEELEYKKKKYVPITDPTGLIEKSVVQLPSKPQDFNSLADLLTEIIDFVHMYVGLSAFFEKLSAYYVLLTWVYDKFEAIPYLRVRGDYGTGKSTFIKVVGAICYRPISLSGSVTPAPVFRVIDKFKGTLLIDEADFKFSEATDLMVKILNCGYQRGIPVLRMEGEGKNMEVRAFDVYGPKIVGTRFNWTDRALESRCISEDLDGHYRGDLRDIEDEFYKSVLVLRNKLLMFRFRYFNKVKFNSKLKDPSIEPRLNQIAIPLISIVQDVKVQSELKQFFQDYNRELVRDRAATLTGTVARAISEIYIKETKDLDMKDRKNFKLRVKKITEYINVDLAIDLSDISDETISPQKIGRVLKKYLKLKTNRDQNGRYLINFENELNFLRERYGIEPESEEENEDNSGNKYDFTDDDLPF